MMRSYRELNLVLLSNINFFTTVSFNTKEDVYTDTIFIHKPLKIIGKAISIYEWQNVDLYSTGGL